jgi:hypothetical protein
MTTSALPRGRQSKIRIVQETTYATAPGAGWLELNTYTNDLMRARTLEADDILGAGFNNTWDARPAAPNVEDATAKLSVPLDLGQFGFWLAAMFGVAAPTGSGPYTAVFTSGGGPIPSLSIERELVAAAQYDGMLGAVIKSMKLPFKPGKGYTEVDLDLVGAQVLAPYTSTAAGTPAVKSLSNRVASYVGSVSLAGTQLGQVIDASMTITNDLTLDRYIGSSEYVSAAILEGIDVAIDMTARYSTDALRAIGVVDPSFLPPVQTLSFGGSYSLTAALAAVRFEPINAPVTNGKTITQTLKGRAEVTSGAPMLTMTLVAPSAAGI